MARICVRLCAELSAASGSTSVPLVSQFANVQAAACRALHNLVATSEDKQALIASSTSTGLVERVLVSDHDRPYCALPAAPEALHPHPPPLPRHALV